VSFHSSPVEANRVHGVHVVVLLAAAGLGRVLVAVALERKRAPARHFPQVLDLHPPFDRAHGDALALVVEHADAPGKQPNVFFLKRRRRNRW